MVIEAGVGLSRKVLSNKTSKCREKQDSDRQMHVEVVACTIRFTRMEELCWCFS